MVHSLAGGPLGRQTVAFREPNPSRTCVVRVSAPRLDQVEPSPSDEVPITRARYSAGAFAPPATPVVVKDTSRAFSAFLRGTHHSLQLHADDDSRQRRTPLTDKQLEDFSAQVLGSSSNVWSAEDRNMPASTSYSDYSVDALVANLKGAQSKRSILFVLKELTRRGELEAVVRSLQDFSKSDQETIIRRWRYQGFLEAVERSQKAKLALQFAKLAMPHLTTPAALVRAVLAACATCRDLEAGMAVVEVARKHKVPVETYMLTSLINVCKAVGNAEKAYRVYLDMRGAGHLLDSHVYGALIATCAEAMKRDLAVMHERKDRYVLLERAFQYVADAEAAGMALAVPVWNSLMVCAGRSGELNRAFEVLTMMQQRGVGANAATYGSLIESCVCARQPEKALRVFEVALQKGFHSEVKIYTQALSACMLPLPHAWERAQDIYAALQRASVRPDKKFFACLMAVAGRCGRLDTTFELLGEMALEGIRPSPTTVSAIIYACLEAGNLALARRVYDLCARQGVYPVLSQFNRMMDVYASECRFGEVVSMLSDMAAAGRGPNVNTYRIVINACAFTDQAGLAFQVFALMHSNKVPILQLSMAQAIYYMLIKSCLGQMRNLWVPAGYRRLGPAARSAAVAVAAAAAAAGAGSGAAAAAAHGRGLPAERGKEAERLLEALGAHKLRRGAHQSNPFDGPPDTIDWASHALSAFHHMLGRGFRPTLETLDCLLNCMRVMMLSTEDPGGLKAAGPQYVSPFVQLRPREEVFEVAFEPRAFAVLDEAISKGLVPPYDPDAPMVLDMRTMPPVVAEVYTLHMLLTLERRARRRQADTAADTAASGSSYSHSITLLVPPFDPDLIKWPSYAKRLMNHYTALMAPDERARLRHRSEYRRARARRRRHKAANKAAAAAAAARAEDAESGVESDGADSDSDAAFGPLGGVASSSYDELEAAISGGEDDERRGAGAVNDPWAREDELIAGGSAAEGTADGDRAGAYIADSTTGLAVAATLQRMKVWMDMNYVNGTIAISAVEVSRWLKRRRQAAEAASEAAAAGGGIGGPAGASTAGSNDAVTAGGGLGSPTAGRGVVGSPVMGVMATGGLAGALTGARMMGIGGPRSRGAAMEQQQRHIRLGMMPSGSDGGAAAAGGSMGREPAPGPSHGITQHPSSQPQAALAEPQQHEVTYRSLFGRQADASGSPGNSDESASRVQPQSTGAPAPADLAGRSSRPAPQPLVKGATKLQPQQLDNSAGAGTSTNPHLEPVLLSRPVDFGVAATSPHTTAYGAHAPNGNGDSALHTTATLAPQQQQQQHLAGSGRWQEPGGSSPPAEALLVSVPQQQVELAVGPGLPVKLPVAAEPSMSPAAAAISG